MDVLTLGLAGYVAVTTIVLRRSADRTRAPAAVPRADAVPEPASDMLISDLELALTPHTDAEAKWRERAVQATARCKRLQAQLVVVSEDSARWSKRALVAEALVRKAQSSRGTPDDHGFRQVRALLARELHPDRSKPGTVEAVIRAEIFKAIWPQIEALERSLR